MKKIEITEKQKMQYNSMYSTLKRIAKGYQTPDKLRKRADKQYGLDFEEALEMSYENIQEEAKKAVKGVKHIA